MSLTDPLPTSRPDPVASDPAPDPEQVADVSPLAPGQKLGVFVIQELVTQGRSGWVYRARHPITRVPHLLKVLRNRDAEVEGRLAEAVARQARLRHPNAVPFTDTVVAEGCFALVCAAVDGPPLRDLLQERRAMPVDDALPLFAEMLAGVHAAHRIGVTHLSLTPDNVRLVVLPDRVVARVLDFGLAAALGTRPAADAPGARYVAPECLEGKGVPASDIFSLGVLFYEMICGVPPFWGRARAGGAGGLPADVKAVERIIPDCPLAVAAALRWALQYDPAERPADGEVFARALFGEDFILFDEADASETEEIDPGPEHTRPVPTGDNPYWSHPELDAEPDPSVRPVKRVVRSRSRLPSPSSLEPTSPIVMPLPPPSHPAPRVVAGAPVAAAGADVAIPPPRPSSTRPQASAGPAVDRLRVARLLFQFVAAPLLLVVGLAFLQAAWAGWQLGVARANVRFASATVDALLADAFDTAADLVDLGAPVAPLQAAVDRGRAAQGLDERVEALVALREVIQRDLHVLPAAKDPASEIRRRRMARTAEALDDDAEAWRGSVLALADAESAPLVGLGEAWGFAEGRPFGQALPFLDGPVQTLATAPER